MRILGVDPGTARLGWGVINGEEMVSCGCVETKVGLAEEARLKTLFEKLSGLIKKYQPEAAAVEKLFFFKNDAEISEIYFTSCINFFTKGEIIIKTTPAIKA